MYSNQNYVVLHSWHGTCYILTAMRKIFSILKQLQTEFRELRRQIEIDLFLQRYISRSRLKEIHAP